MTSLHVGRSRLNALAGRMHGPHWIFVALAGSLLAAPGCGTPFQHREIVERSAPTAKTLRIENQIGRIDYTAVANAFGIAATITKIGRGASGDEAAAALRKIDVSLSAAEKDAGMIVARATHPNGSGMRGYEVRWKFTGPADIDIVIDSAIGDVAVTGISGAVKLRAGIGDVSVSADSKTSRGRTELAVRVGDVRARGLAGGLVIDCGTGDVVAEAGGSIDVRTDVGDITLRVLPDSPKEVSVRTGVGEVRTYLPKGRVGIVNAVAGVGRVHAWLTDINLTIREQRQDRFAANLGDQSQPVLDVSSGVGDVVLQSR